MRRYKPVVLVLLWVTVATLLVSGCSFRVGWISREGIGRSKASFMTFMGTREKSVSLEQGQTLILDYAIRLNKGSLHVTVSDPDGTVLWEQQFTQDASDSLELPVRQAGRHHIIIRGDGAGGSYELKWKRE